MSGLQAHVPPTSPSAGWVAAKPFDLGDNLAYGAWRATKLENYPKSVDALRVPIKCLATPTAEEKSALLARCRLTNMAVYALPAPQVNPGVARPGDREMRADLRQFASAFGLGHMETHRSAEDDGIVAIEVTGAQSKRGFIPYTNKPLSWHTDGYYNPPEAPIRAMLLHCVRPAREGGVNALLDPEIIYIRLRDKDPALVAAMMHPEAMTIPESVEEDGGVRPVSIGPVILIDETGRLTMRYTARTRNIHWRDDADTRAAVALINRLLTHEEEELIIKYKMAAGEGLLCNNVLHTRSAFEDDDQATRLLYRVRYRERIAQT
ncbi:MAG: TauD/TfdA family dioxygenase [Hyphomicrobiaceae bacterium]|nr:TauD/TfdA family dioxygenase [Hyphomicrobiaceae bacterium]MCC0007177.1 TauD/TfdA family dioxygenase [Hyphomicrobiaceae bacterium]